MKEAIVFKHRSGAWAAKDRDTGKLIGGLHDTELEAYKAAGREGYVVI
jgi:hypothetical protein